MTQETGSSRARTSASGPFGVEDSDMSSQSLTPKILTSHAHYKMGKQQASFRHQRLALGAVIPNQGRSLEVNCKPITHPFAIKHLHCKSAYTGSSGMLHDDILLARRASHNHQVANSAHMTGKTGEGLAASQCGEFCCTSPE